MLPDNLASSYKSYKADTSVFTTWLSKAAIACGYKVSTTATASVADPPTQNDAINKQARLKGKARKLAKESTKAFPAQTPLVVTPSVKHTVTTKEMLQQAQVIAGRIEVPETLRNTLQRAIEARRRCADWFQTSNVQNQYSNKGHQHFIAVLEETLNILDQRKIDKKSSGGAQATTLTSDQAADTESWAEITNRFQQLTTEDTFVDIDAESENMTDMSTTFELEDESLEMKMSLMIFCFFEDLHRIQEFLHSVWKKYKENKIGLISASLITNTAIEIVRRNEEEILASAPKLFSMKRSYDTIAIVIFYANAFNHGQDPEEKMKSNEMLRPTPFDDFIYLSTARTLMKYDFLHGMAPDYPGYPIPSYPLRTGFASRPELLGTPYMNKKEEEDCLLSQMMMDIDLFDLYNTHSKGQMGQYAAPAEDPLSTGLRKLKTGGILSVNLVFASRIFLDIRDILGAKVSEGHRHLKMTGRNIDKKLQATGSFSHPAESYLWLSKDLSIVEQIREIDNRWINGPAGFGVVKSHMVKQFGLGNPNWGNLNDPTPMNPVAAGLSNRPKKSAISDLDPAMQPELDRTNAKQAKLRGVQFPAKPRLTNMATARILVPESAVGPGGVIDPVWQERLIAKFRAEAGFDDEPCSAEHGENARKLDIRLIKPHHDPNFVFSHSPMYCGMVALKMIVSTEQAGLAHCGYHVVTTLVAYLYAEARRTGFLTTEWPEMDRMIELHIEDMFNGNLPQSATEASIRFQKHLGMSTTNAREYERGLPYKEPYYPCASISTAIRPFLEHQAPFSDAVKNLQSLVQEYRQSKDNETKHKRRNARRQQLTPLQFLTLMEEFVRPEIAKVRFDYITLSITCHRLMKTFRLEILNQLKKEHWLYPHPDSNEPSYSYMALDILDRCSKGDNKQLEVVAGVLKEYLVGKQL